MPTSLARSDRAILPMRRRKLIYLCRQMIDIPYNDIGKRFNRDHSTIMSSVEKIEKKTKESRELQEELEIIIKNIREN